MKKGFWIFLVFASLVACTKPVEDNREPQPTETQEMKIETMMPSDVAGVSFVFTESSRMVVNGERSKKTEADGAKATFTFTDKVKAPYSAVYPQGVYSSMDNLTIPARQKYVAGGIDAASAVMLGYSASGSGISLTHAMAFLRLVINPGSLGSDNIYEITISGANGEQLSGDFRPDFKNGTLASTSKATSLIVRDAGDGIPMGAPVIVAIPPRRSIRLNFDVTDIKGVNRSFKYEQALSLTAGVVSEVRLDFEKEEGSAELHLTPFTMLNAGESAVGDHASMESRSSLVQMKSSLTEYNNDASASKPQTYSRIKRLPNGSYMLMWQRGAATRSDNNGMDTYYALGNDIFGWTYKGCLFEHNDKAPGCKGGTVARYYTCPELLVLRSGELIAVNSFWAPSTYSIRDNRGDHGLAIKRSSDNGQSWSEESIIYYGQCWEPFLLEMPNGEIHCYFTEARPWVSSSNSGTSLVLSRDGGKTWTPEPGADPYRVMRKTWYHADSKMNKFTDQMPVGIDICGTGKLAFAMEDVDSETSTSTTHSVAVLYSPGTPGWKYLEDDETGPSTRTDKVGRDACAPYLVQFPSGETVLSYSRENGTWPYCYKMGDASARNFGPEKIALPTGGNWSATTIDGTHCLLVASAYSKAIHLCRYALNHDIKATRRTVKVDGDNSEWRNTDDALYFCKDASTDATLRCAADDENLYILLEVSDIRLSSSDYMTVLVGSSSSSKNSVKVKVGPTSFTSANKSVSVSGTYGGTLTDDSDIDTGYLAEISIPLSALDTSSGKVSICASFDDNPKDSVLCSL